MPKKKDEKVKKGENYENKNDDNKIYEYLINIGYCCGC